MSVKLPRPPISVKKSTPNTCICKHLPPEFPRCRLHHSINFAYMFLPKLLTFDLTLLPQSKLLSSFTFTSCSTVLHEHFHTKKYLPIQQGVRVCLHRSQARAKSHGSKPKHPPVQQKFKKIF